MNRLRLRIAALVALPLALLAADEFEIVEQDVAVASVEASGIEAAGWANSKNPWHLSHIHAREVMKHLRNEVGKTEILNISPLMLGPLTTREESSFQLFAFERNNRKCILVSAFPRLPMPYLTGRIRIYDGGYEIWWALYDTEIKKFIDAGSR